MPEYFIQWHFPKGTRYLDKVMCASNWREQWFAWMGSFQRGPNNPHSGVDFAFYLNVFGLVKRIPPSTKVRSVAAGTIIKVMHVPADGEGSIIVFHPDKGIQSVYAHMVPEAGLNVGDAVGQGQLLGVLGTGGKY